MEEKPAQDPTSTSAELAELRMELSKLSDRVKENQTSTFSAFRTLADDIVEFLQGTRELRDLRPAALGLLFAYLRPRLILFAGGLVGVLLGIGQLAFLWSQHKQINRQNQLIEQQGVYLEAQTRANQISAITELVMELDPRDSIRSHLAKVQLASFGQMGVEVLLDLSETPGPAAVLAAEALYAQGSFHSASQVRTVLGRWADRLGSALPPDFTESDAELRNYVKTLADRARLDSAFASKLSDELGRTSDVGHTPHNSKLSKFQPSFPSQLLNLYEKYLTQCAPDRNTSSCDTPRWHHSMYSLGLNIRGEGPGFAPESDSAFHALIGAMAESDRIEKSDPKATIASWFLGGSTVPDARQVARQRPQ